MKGILLFDIDGVIRDVSGSYRLAIQKTVHHFTSWTPSLEVIDLLKAEGNWNNDWDTSLELIKRHLKTQKHFAREIPRRDNLISIFNNYYFGGNPESHPSLWKGFIKNEPLLIDKDFFEKLSQRGIYWGFVSGAERTSALYVLKNKLNLVSPKLIAMGDAPEKPNPNGLIMLSREIADKELGPEAPTISYLGDTVADVRTILNARKVIPEQSFKSYAVAPPHLHKIEAKELRFVYENKLKDSGADYIISSTRDILNYL